MQRLVETRIRLGTFCLGFPYVRWTFVQRWGFAVPQVDSTVKDATGGCRLRNRDVSLKDSLKSVD